MKIRISPKWKFILSESQVLTHSQKVRYKLTIFKSNVTKNNSKNGFRFVLILSFVASLRRSRLMRTTEIPFRKFYSKFPHSNTFIGMCLCLYMLCVYTFPILSYCEKCCINNNIGCRLFSNCCLHIKKVTLRKPWSIQPLHQLTWKLERFCFSKEIKQLKSLSIQSNKLHLPPQGATPLALQPEFRRTVYFNGRA